jgi:hypothetical protein
MQIETNFRFWPIATDIHVGDQAKSGLVVLKVSFVAPDPTATSNVTKSCGWKRPI